MNEANLFPHTMLSRTLPFSQFGLESVCKLARLQRKCLLNFNLRCLYIFYMTLSKAGLELKYLDPHFFHIIYIYHISPDKCSRSYAKYKYGTFILCPICKAKSLSNFVFRRVFEIVKTKYKSKLDNYILQILQILLF